MTEQFAAGFLFGCFVMLVPWVVGTLAYWNGRAAEKGAPASEPAAGEAPE